MSSILSDCYVLDTIGPFQGNMNNKSIATHILRICDPLIEWCGANDIILVDHGFRNVIDTFCKMGYALKMPSFLKKGQSQYTIEEANELQLCTKKRWIVESY
jgi:hypothetical protein